MRQPAPAQRLVVALAVVAAPVMQSTPAYGVDFLQKLSRTVAAPFKAAHRQPPPTIEDCAVERLAAEIDWLEHHIDSYGSIVAKHPDVWGQSRLMRHRVEYENELKQEIGKFKERNNASIRRSDQSFLELMLAIDAAAGSPAAAGSSKSPKAANLSKSGKSSGTPDSSSKDSASAVNLLTITTGTFADTGITQNPPFALLPGSTNDVFGLEDNRVGLEPTVHLDQLSRYLNHLNELRRVNEGDDIADSPGYSLNLVRIPVSVLPGERTQHGHGAEITVIADPMLGDDLLPTTFRNLVTNDLIDQLAPPLTFVVNDSKVRGILERSGDGTEEASTVPSRQETRRDKQVQKLDEGAQSQIREKAVTVTVSVPSGKTRRARLPLPGEHVLDVVGVKQMNVLIAAVHEALANHPANKPCIEYTDVRGFLQDELDGAHELLGQPAMAWVWADLPSWNLPATIRGLKLEELERIRCRFFAALGTTCDLDPDRSASVVIPDLSGNSSQECCNSTTCQHLCRTTAGVLAWMILVESALLNERLVEDMRQAASAKGVIGSASGPLSGPYYGPDPGPEARRSFNDYIRLRWPIRVFALDPVSQEQNVEDAFSMRREMQIAMALAASGSRVNTQAMMRYARRLETDMATIALNKTAVGFTHGSDTFGWRFYPRIQTPPTRNNIVNFAETLVGSNSRRRDLAERAIEPGIRECTAIIVMPSFVPYVSFEVRTNWFALNHPKHTDQSMRQAMTLSRSVKAMQMTATECFQCAGAYRDGEVVRLLKRVEQLDRELPLQSMLAQIPYENTSGGFELFNTGVTDLAPELIGWYGAEGIAEDATTTLYIVGNGFSVRDTSIVAGGRPVKVELISRQLLRAEFPKGLKPSKHHGDGAAPGVSGGHATRSRARGKSGVVSPITTLGLVTDQSFDGIRLTSDAEPLPAPAGPTLANEKVQTLVQLPASPPPEVKQSPSGGVLRPQGPVTVTRPSPKATAGDSQATVNESLRSENDSPRDESSPDTGGAPPGQSLRGPQKSEYDVTVDGTVPTSSIPQQPARDYCNAGPMIDVHLATPYGVSNHLLIPFIAAEKKECCTEEDPAACALVVTPPVCVALTAKHQGGGTVWAIDEHFDTTPDMIAIRVPKWFTPPSEAALRWTVADAEGPVIAQFSLPAPHFDAATRSYVFGGAELRNFIGAAEAPAAAKSLRGAIRPYLVRTGADAIPSVNSRDFTAKAELLTGKQTIPIEGELVVSISKRD